MGLIESLNWRYATKKFDKSKIIKPEDLSLLKESIRLAATSYGLQPFKVAIIDNEFMKEKLRPATFGQTQITECSHVFVFAHLTKIEPEFIDNYIQLCAEERNLEISNLEGYSDFMKTKLGGLNESEINVWASKQSYIGMTNLLVACAELKIDACPIEGFEANEYNKLLSLNEKNLSASVVVAVGYRADDDANQHLKKVRLAMNDLFF